MDHIPQPPFEWICHQCQKLIIPYYCGQNTNISWNYDCDDHAYITVFANEIDYIVYYNDLLNKKKYRLSAIPFSSRCLTGQKVLKERRSGKEMKVDIFFPLPITNNNVIDPKPIVDRILKLKAYL